MDHAVHLPATKPKNIQLLYLNTDFCRYRISFWTFCWKLHDSNVWLCYGLVGCLAYTAGPLDSYRPIYSLKSKEQSKLFKQKYNTVMSTSKQKKTISYNNQKKQYGHNTANKRKTSCRSAGHTTSRLSDCPCPVSSLTRDRPTIST